MRQDSLVSGTIALTTAAVFNRIVGFVFRAYLVRVVGQEAIGLYQMTYPLYASVMTVATAGISVGVAKLTAGARQRGDSQAISSTLKTGCYLALFTGVAGMILLMISSGFIAKTLLGEERAYLPLLVLAPALPIVSLAGALRGYYQGMRYMYLVAIALVTEQIAHVVASIQLALRLKTLGVGAVSTGLALGCTVGELVGLLTLGLLAFFIAKGRQNRAQVNYAPLLGMVLPVATGRIILAATSALNTILIPRSLRFMGYSATDAAVVFGQLTGMAINVLFIPAVLTFPFASNLLPLMAESDHAAQTTLKKRNFHQALSFSLILGIPCSIVFVTAGPLICELLFGVSEAGRLLSTMGWVAWMIYIQHITTATLQGLGKPAIPARNAAVCTLLSSTSVITLSRIWPSLKIDAAVYAIMVGIITGALLGLVAVLKEIGGLRTATIIITRGALAGAFAIFITENVLASLTNPSPLYQLSIACAMVALSFLPAAWLLRLHKQT
ncbi:MAG: stage V sporulation protein B [Bacillota bacterium]|nr:MAG: stage V sporulation protein B [Bacillota bacterium]